MIDAWYFCSSVQAGPTVVAAYLAALRAIRSRQADPELVAIALAELMRAEPELRCYALPDVLAAGLRDVGSEPHVAAGVRALLRTALDTIDPEVGRHVLKAWDDLRADGPAEDVLVSLLEAMKRSREIRREQPPEPAPYVHVKEHATEIVLLALCVQAAQRGGALAQELAEGEETGTLIGLALGNGAGRLGLLLGAQAAIGLQADLPDEQAVEAALLDPAHGTAMWEPDLLSALARCAFGYPDSRLRGRGSARRAVMEELVLFSRLSQWERGRRAPTATAQQALSRLGLDTNPDHSDGLYAGSDDTTRLVLWQAVLWQLAVDLDPVTTATAIAEHWLPPYREIAGTIRVDVPISERASKAWTRKVRALAQLRLTAAARYEMLPRNNSRRLYTPPTFAVLTLSPWLTRSPEKAWDLPRAHDGIVLLRLMAASMCCLEMLEACPGEPPVHLLGLAMHAWEVLRKHGKWIGDLDLARSGQVEAAPTMSPKLSGLALFLWRELKRMGSGENEHVSPSAIAGYLLPGRHDDLGFAERAIRAQALDQSFEFVLDGLSGSVPGETTGEGRWRQSPDGSGPSNAERVLRKLAESAAWPNARRAPALLRVHTGTVPSRARALSKHLGRYNGLPDAWLVLAAIPLVGDELTSPELTEALAAVGRSDRGDPAFPLAVATGRLEAVLSRGRQASDHDEASEHKDNWLEEWRHRLAMTSDRKHLPRPLRWFMLELLAKPLAGTRIELRAMEELIDAEVEFGLGTVYDRWTLFERLGIGSSLPPEFTQSLRLRMLRELYFLRYRRPWLTDVRDPGEVRRDALSEALLDRLLTRFILDIGWLSSSLGGTSVAELVPELWRETRKSADLRELQADLGASVPDPGSTDRDRRLLVGAVVDPMKDRLRCHLRRQPAEHTATRRPVADGWTKSADELGKLINAARETVLLGVVAARQPGLTWVNVGLGRPLSWPHPLDGAAVGEHVAVYVQPRAGGLVVREKDGVEALPAEPYRGELQQATVEINRRVRPPSVVVRLSARSFSLDEERSDRVRRQWMPDLVSLLADGFAGERAAPGVSRADETVAFPATARYQDGAWLPADQGPTEFFAHLAGLGEDPLVRLVLIGNLAAREARYSIAPGRNFVMPHTIWEPRARGEIERMLKSLGGDVLGLVIFARVRKDEDGTLWLVEDENKRLDDRALQWRHLFDDNTEFEASLDPETGKLVMPHEVPGFPPVVVDVGTSETVCRFTPKRWTDIDQRRAAVDGELSPHRALAVGEPSIDTLNNLLDLQKDDVVELERILLSGPPRLGRLLGWTREGLSVDIEAESLHFGDLGTEFKAVDPFVRRRKAVVTGVWPRKLGAARQTDGIPASQLVMSVPEADRSAVEDHLLRARTLRGIVVDAPVGHASDEDLFKIWLSVGGTVAPLTVRRRDFQYPPERQGVLVRAERMPGESWRLVAQGRSIQVKPLWRLVEGDQPPSGAIFLGVVRWDRGLRTLCQLPASDRGHGRVSPPTLHLSPPPEGAPPAQLAQRVVRRDGGHPARWRKPAYDLAQGQVELYGRDGRGDRARRAVVRIDRDEGASLQLSGQVEGSGAGADARVESVDMRIVRRPDGEVEARRVFVLSEQDYSQVETPAAAETEDESVGWRTYLAGERPPLPARLDRDGRHVTLRTSWKVPVDGQWTFQVPLAAEEEPWVDQWYQDGEVQVVLAEGPGGGLVASYRDVPPLNLTEAARLFRRQGMIPGEMWRPRQRIYYVDRQETPTGVVHRFEWGYGYTFQVAEKRMTVGRKANWPVRPFHGDPILEVRVTELAHREGPLLDIAIDVAHLGWLSHFYADSVKGFVALAELTGAPDGTNLAIAAVHLRRRRDPETMTRHQDSQRVMIKRVRLSGNAVKAIRPLWGGRDAAEASTPRLAFMRLDKHLFTRTGGRKVELNFVRPELGVEGGLEDSWRVFLDADVIERIPNDVQLLLRSGDLLGSEKGFTVKVRRRDFSERQELLRQLYASDLRPGEDETRHRGRALAGDVYLVKLQDVDPARRWAGGQVRDGLDRPVSALRGHVLASDSPCFATARRSPDGYTLELRPNVVFRLSQGDIASYQGVGDRAIVRVTPEPGATTRSGKLVLRPVLWGDSEFIPEGGRPAVLLPMQNLLQKSDSLKQALDRGTYTVAGLPSFILSAIPRWEDAMRVPGHRDFAEALLTTGHPKIAMIYQERPVGQHVRSQSRYGRPDGLVRAGVLVLADDGAVNVRAVDGTRRRIPWSQVSFADGGAKALRERCERQGWQYHDFTTTRRSPSPPHAPMPPADLPSRARVTEEPVFFSEGWSLRHQERQLRQFGFPASELLENRGSSGKGRARSRGTYYPVAGVSWRSRRSQGIWIEMAPGHVVELPGALLTTNDAARLPLTDVDWSHFAPGDLVQLEIRRGHQLDIGSIGLCGWTPGPRVAFGPRTLLPVAAIHPQSQAITLGAGAIALGYPVEPESVDLRPGDHIWLGADNSLVPATSPAADLRRDNVVLLTAEAGRLSLVGLPGLVPELADDPQHLTPWVRKALAGPDAQALIGLNGGSLPVTVEDVCDGRVVISRRLQRDGCLPSRKSVPVVPLGMLQGQVVLRAGARLYQCRLSTLLPGMPTHAAPWALEQLRERAPNLVWLTSREGRWHIGLAASSRRAQAETRVTLLAAFGDDKTSGVLCWDAEERRPCWLSAAAVGWITPTEAELSCWVGGNDAERREVLLSRRSDGTVSVIHTAANQQRLDQLRVGHPIRVELLELPGTPMEDGRLRFLGKVYLTEVLVEVLVNADAARPESGRPRFCEVERRQSTGHARRVKVSVCDLGARRLPMALPRWAIGSRRAEAGDDIFARYRLQAVAGSRMDVQNVDERIVSVGFRVISDGTGHASIGELADAALAWLSNRGDRLFGQAIGETLDVVPALAALVTLARIGDDPSPVGRIAGRAAVHVCRQLGLRATVSRHLEPLLARWLQADNVSSRGELWRRLNEITLADYIDTSGLERIHAVDDGIRGRTAVRPDPDLTLVSACIAASAGAHHDFDDIHRYPGLTREINSLGRALTPRATELVSQQELIPAQRDHIAILLRTAATGVPLTFLGIPAVLQDPGYWPNALNLLRELKELLSEIAATSPPTS